MTKQIQTRKSTAAAKRFDLHRLFRSALTASLIAGCVSVAAAQTDLTLPAFPSDSSGLSLPVAQESATPTAAHSSTRNAVTQHSQAPSNRSVGQLATKMLGLKRRTSNTSQFASTPAFAVPAFPAQPLATSTVALPAFPSTTPQTNAANPLPSAAPTICRSSGTKSNAVTTDTVVLASAQELPSPPQFSVSDDSDSLIPPSPANNANSAQASFTDSTSTDDSSSDEALSESLIDIEFPVTSLPTAQVTAQSSALPSAPAPISQSNQRLPELVKRPPAMQLHIGGDSSRKITTATQLQRPQLPVAETPMVTPEASSADEATANFSLSDSSDKATQPNTRSSIRIGGSAVPTVDRSKSGSEIINSNPMNVRIEGEPGVSKAIAGSTPPVVNASTFAKQTGSATNTKTPSLGNSSRGTTHKSVSDNSTDRTAAVGERLEVDLHEATNVETAQPISGLSIEHPDLCQVLKSGERTISLVGLKAGQTRVALFTTDAAGERKIEIREVVIAGTETRQADMKSMAADIGRSVHNMYPKSRIEVIAEAEGLTVQGYASTEDEAKKIISLVRRTSLQPVVDRLATYK